jgi:predicted dehydrogenase
MNITMKTIRVGLIRCDTHGMWFGAQMDDHDPLLLRQPMLPKRNYRYSWQTAGVHYLFYTHYCHPWRMTAPRVKGFCITKVWDEDRKSAEMFARVFHGRPHVCDSFEEVSDEVDLVFIADCNDDGSDHLKLASPGLRKGVPTFVDKPFANSLRDVRAIQRLANKYRAPVMSLSMLQTNPAVARIKRRLDEVGEVSFGTITCLNTHWAALIHAISIAHHVFGTGVRAVSCLKVRNHTALHLDYGDRPDRPEHGIVINCGTARFRFTDMFITAYGPEGSIHGLALDDFNACEGSAVILDRVKRMVETGNPDPLSNEMVQSVAVAEACRAAEKSGRMVRVRDSW